MCSSEFLRTRPIPGLFCLSTFGCERSSASLRRAVEHGCDVAAQRWGLRVHSRRTGGSADQPSDFFARAQAELAPLEIDPPWNFKYNAGANPIAFQITTANATHSQILDILREAYELA